MKRIFQNLLLGGVGAGLLAACTAESMSEDHNPLNMETAPMVVQDIVAGDLVGTWKLSSMDSDTVVDLNRDSTYVKDILKETDCFKDVFFTFHENGDIDTGQAKLYFETESGAMECKYKEYEAEYAVEGDELQIIFTFNGNEMRESKTIALSTTAEGEFLTVSLEYWEAKTYLPDNPQTPTGAADIDKIDMVYKKVQ